MSLAAPVTTQVNILSGLPMDSSCVLHVFYALLQQPVAAGSVRFDTGKNSAQVRIFEYEEHSVELCGLHIMPFLAPVCLQ